MPETEQPLVSVVIPMLNEEAHIGACLDAFEAQSYSGPIEVLVVDGGSTDRSRSIVESRAKSSRSTIRIVENPKKKASAAFNRGVEAATGEFVFLFSSHGVPSSTYLDASVRGLRTNDISGVGGRYEHVGTDPTSQAIGLAMVSPFGMASPHRFSTEPRDVDTISHPGYRRSSLQSIGPFDENLERNSDYELNWRLRQRGDRLLFDPGVSSIYRPRPSLTALAKQFWWYGRWKARVATAHPDSVRIRHLVPPLAVVALAISPLLCTTRLGRQIVATCVGVYVGAMLTATAASKPGDHDADSAVLALSFPVMHFSWGAGMVVSLIEDRLKR